MPDEPPRKRNVLVRTFIQSYRRRQQRRQLEHLVETFVRRAAELGAPELADLVWLASLFWANGDAQAGHVALVKAAEVQILEHLRRKGDWDRVLPRLR